MRYLTSYKVFESVAQLLDIRDILVDLTDEGLRVDYDLLTIDSLRVSIRKNSLIGPGIKPFDASLTVDPIRRLISYLDHEGIKYDIEAAYGTLKLPNVTSKGLEELMDVTYITIILKPFYYAIKWPLPNQV